MPVRTVIERGPKGKRAVAFSLEWPGWSRGAKTPEVALETLESYRERYRPIADLAGMARRVRRRRAARDRGGQGRYRLDRFLGHLVRAIFDRAWTDDRGGVRPRDHAVAGLLGVLRRRRGAGLAGDAQGPARRRTRPRSDHQPHHPLESENFAKRVGLKIPEEGAMTPDGLREYREAYVEAMRAYNAGEVERRMRSWTLPYLIRHSAFHTLDHAWEMEDKDLSGEGSMS